MNKPRPKALTAFAEQGMIVSETFKAAVQNVPLGGFRAELMEPEASTGQGVRALQHIRIVPSGGGLSITIGSVHVGSRRAEVRSFGYVVRAFQERFGRLPPFDHAGYENLVQAMERVLRTLMMDVVRLDPEPPAATPVDAPVGVPKSNAGLWIGIAFGVLVVLALGGFALWKVLG